MIGIMMMSGDERRGLGYPLEDFLIYKNVY